MLPCIHRFLCGLLFWEHNLCSKKTSIVWGTGQFALCRLAAAAENREGKIVVIIKLIGQLYLSVSKKENQLKKPGLEREDGISPSRAREIQFPAFYLYSTRKQLSYWSAN